MVDVVALLQGRIMYLEQENVYLKDLLARYFRLFSLIKEKEDKDAKETK